MILGHVAAAVLIKRFRKESSLSGLLLGAIFPDAGDKSLKKIRNLKAGRSFFHSLLGTLLTLTAAAFVLRGRFRRGFIEGYASHILIDAPQDIPWLYPFREHQFGYTPFSYSEKFKRQLTHPKYWETVLIIWSILVGMERLWVRKIRG